MFRALTLALSFSLFTPYVCAELDLDSWSRLLGAAVSSGQVDYHRWDNNPEFDALVAQIATADTNAMSDREALVFYINTYNILAARGILNDHSPSTLWGRYVYFKRDKYTIAGKRVNLYDLEHELILPLKEPRIHFAIVCASQSCPLLRDEAYTRARLDQQLDDAAEQFINDTRRNQLDPETGSAQISRIFKWFKEDFEDSKGSVQQYMAQYVANPKARELLLKGGFRVRFLEYDWSLNGTR